LSEGKTLRNTIPHTRIVVVSFFLKLNGAFESTLSRSRCNSPFVFQRRSRRSIVVIVLLIFAAGQFMTESRPEQKPAHSMSLATCKKVGAGCSRLQVQWHEDVRRIPE